MNEKFFLILGDSKGGETPFEIYENCHSSPSRKRGILAVFVKEQLKESVNLVKDISPKE